MEHFDDFLTQCLVDKAYFHINVNKQNSLHSPKVIMWAAILARGIIVPYFFSKWKRSCNGGLSWELLSDASVLGPSSSRISKSNSRIWFQQDGATCHTATVSMDLLKEMFPGKLISWRGDIEVGPWSPDLSPCDYCLWGYLKSRVYEDNQTTIHMLKQNIVRKINAFPRSTCQCVFENSRIQFKQWITQLLKLSFYLNLLSFTKIKM